MLDWRTVVEPEVLKLISRHVTSCCAALLSFGFIGIVAYLVLAMAHWMGWFGFPDSLMANAIGWCEAFVLGSLFLLFSVWFMVDLFQLRKKTHGGWFLEIFLVA